VSAEDRKDELNDAYKELNCSGTDFFFLLVHKPFAAGNDGRDLGTGKPT
jgi:hypothetical protein